MINMPDAVAARPNKTKPVPASGFKRFQVVLLQLLKKIVYLMPRLVFESLANL